MFPKGILKEYASPLLYIARIIDVFCVLAGGAFAYYFHFGNILLSQNYQIIILVGVVLTLLVFPSSGIYRSWRGSRWLHQARMVSVAWVLVVFWLIVIGFLSKFSAEYSPEWISAWFIISWTLLLIFRLLVHQILRLMREKGWNERRIIVVGTGVLGQRVIQNILASPWFGLSIIAALDENDKFCSDDNIHGVEIKYGLHTLPSLIASNSVDEVLVALPLSQNKLIENVLHQLRHSTVTVRFVPDMVGLRLINHSITEFAGFPVLNLSESPISGGNKIVKFLEDKLLALLVVALLSPLCLLIAIGVKLSSPGPVFYRQERISWNGNPFTMYKFRTMSTDAEKDSGPVWSKGGEHRATAFGTFLRKTSLDELPQFINVLNGDMSVVGPRPERPFFVEKFKDQIPDYMKKHMVKAGITGWAQVNGWRGDTCLKTRIEYDMYYVENWSLWFDIKIVVMTVFKGFTNRNAY